MTRLEESAYDLIRFVQHLHDLSSDFYNGLLGPMERNRCKRWMDAVLPPPVETSEGDLPAELTKAAE